MAETVVVGNPKCGAMHRWIVYASYERDSKRYHRYTIEDNPHGIVGSVYISNRVERAPKNLTITISERSSLEEEQENG